MKEFYSRSEGYEWGYTYETKGALFKEQAMKSLIIVGGRLDKWWIAGDNIEPSKGFLECGYSPVSGGLKRLRTGRGLPTTLIAERNLGTLLTKLGRLCDGDIRFDRFFIGISSPFAGPAVGIWRWSDKRTDLT